MNQIISQDDDQHLLPLMSLRVAPPSGAPDDEEDPELMKLPQALEMAFALKSERARVLGRQDGDVPEDAYEAEDDDAGPVEDMDPADMTAREKQRLKNKNKKKKKKKKQQKNTEVEEQSKESEETGGKETDDEVKVEVE
jgi:hypothetical protein